MNFRLANHDEKMLRAIQIARDTVMMPFELLEKGRTKSVSLKTPFENDGKIENAWVIVKKTSDKGFICLLQNDLEYSKSPKLGDEVLITSDKIIDWTCSIDALDGKMAGNYTLRAMWASMAEPEKVELGSKLAPSTHDDELGFTFYNAKKSGTIPFGPIILAIIGGLCVLGYWLLKEHFK